jgi:hypothetical protein
VRKALDAINASNTLNHTSTRVFLFFCHLQHHASLRTIKKKLVRKALDAIKKMADDEIACNDDSSDGESKLISALAVPLIAMLHDQS